MGENDINNNLRKLEGENGGGARRALGDVTNHIGQRGIPSFSRNTSSKSISGSKRSAEDSEGDSDFWRQVSVAVDKVEKQRCRTAKCAKIGGGTDIGLSPLKGGKTYRLQNLMADDSMSNPMGACEVRKRVESALDSIDLGENRGVVDVVDVDEVVAGGGGSSECCEKDGNVGASARIDELGEKGCLWDVVDVDEVVKEGGVSSESGEIGKEGQGEETRGFSDERESVSSREGLSARALSDIGKSVGFDRAVTSRLKECQETASFGLERCTFLKGEGSGSSMDLLKHCSCSFCTKAAYIWSDLQYQDAKGRLSILAKSQKEASNLARKYSVENETGRTQGTSGKVAHVETDLGSLWKSLFLQMENVFGTESSQLETSFLALKDFRDDYKMKLEAINGMPSDVQQCSSEASDHP